ncbi:MAG: hypothetical protein H8E66_00530 [Planctomycetes bacterium]|nr:hypothetical protein [Planctomycetota bacterium]
MNPTRSWHQSLLSRLQITPIGLTALILVVVGLALGASVHKGFVLLMALGAFGPGVLRQFRLLDDLDEFQKEAAAQAGLRAYLAGAIFLMVIVITQGWHQLSLSNDEVPASAVVTSMLVVYYASYCLSFWDTRKAVSRILLAFGLFWAAFVVMSHAGEPMALLMEGLVVPGPFILCAVLCRKWPRAIGLVLLAASVGAIFFFNLLPLGDPDRERVLNNLFVISLIPLPLAVAGVALVTSKRELE